MINGFLEFSFELARLGYQYWPTLLYTPLTEILVLPWNVVQIISILTDLFIELGPFDGNVLSFLHLLLQFAEFVCYKVL